MHSCSEMMQRGQQRQSMQLIYTSYVSRCCCSRQHLNYSECSAKIHKIARLLGWQLHTSIGFNTDSNIGIDRLHATLIGGGKAKGNSDYVARWNQQKLCKRMIVRLCRSSLIMLSDRASHTRATAIIAALLIVLRPACSAILDPAAYAQDLRDNRQDAIAADSLLGKLNLPTGIAQRQNTYYASLNSYVPVAVLVNCHFGPEPFNGKASASASAQQYVNDVAYIVGDGYQPVVKEEQKGTYNQSWSGGLLWKGWCDTRILHVEHIQTQDDSKTINITLLHYVKVHTSISDNCWNQRTVFLLVCRCQIFNGRPSCNFTFDAGSRASGLAQITRVPKSGTVEFVSCGIYMDGGVVNSTSCFQVRQSRALPAGKLRNPTCHLMRMRSMCRMTQQQLCQSRCLLLRNRCPRYTSFQPTRTLQQMLLPVSTLGSHLTSIDLLSIYTMGAGRMCKLPMGSNRRFAP